MVETDYEDFSIVYSCTDILGLAKTEFLWILSRHPEQVDDSNKEVIWDDIKKII